MTCRPIRARWGVERRGRYRAQLCEEMRQLLDCLELGPARDDLFPGCRGVRVEHHLISYRVTEDEIIIGRVLH